MHKIFVRIYNLIRKNKAWAVLVSLVYLVLCGYFFSQLRFEEDITKLIPKSEESDAASKVISGLKFADKLTVIIKGEEQEQLVALADAFLDSLSNSKEYIKSVQGVLSDEDMLQTFEFINQHIPLFLDSTDYTEIQRKLGKDSLTKIVESNYKSLLSPAGFVGGKMVTHDPLGITFMALSKFQQLGAGNDFVVENGYLFTKDRKQLLLFVNPAFSGSETERNTIFAKQLYAYQNALNKEFKASISYFGASLIAVANAAQIKQDILTTTLVSFVVLMLILMLYYKRVFIPVILFIPTVLGVLFAVSVLYFVKDTISAISLSIGAVLIGVTIDYALHILTHYKLNNNIESLYKDITQPLIMSSTTTAVAFLCLLFVKSEALKDLGIFAAVAVIASAVFSLIIVPHLYSPTQKLNTSASVLDKMATFPFEKSKVLLWSCLAVLVVSCFTYQKVKFNDDISLLNYVPEDIKAAEKLLEESTSLASKSLYFVEYSKRADAVLEQNLALEKKLKQAQANKEILSYSSLGTIVLSKKQQETKIKQWQDFWQKNNGFKQDLSEAGVKMGFSANAYMPFFEKLNQNFGTLELEDYLGLKALALDDFIGQNDGLYTISTLVKINEKDRESVLQNFKANTLIIDRQQLNETFLGHLKDDFNTLVNYSFIAVLVILFVFFRRLELVLISAVPIGLTGLVTAGIMGLFGIELNIFSTIVCTLVFGHGVDFSIFMTSALQKEYTTGRDETPIYRISILLAVLTTILAIGALIFAEHPALKSISAVSLIGVFAAVLITFVFYPILFRAILSRRPQKGKMPMSLGYFFFSVTSFLYYGLGGFIFSILSTLGSFWPGNKEKIVLILRKFMSKYMQSVLFSNPYLKKTKIINTRGEDFKKPAVFIANHSSFLDILSLGMLYPKTIFLVSDWVYNSPIFGKGVRFSGFYPVSQGLEGSLEHLRPKLEEGYSIMVFPEGTRSTDNVIKRFHKGAFYLAEYFDLDVLPILIHGASESLPKNDFFIRDYRLTLKILDRITPHNKDFGEGFRERTKKISSYFKQEYAALRQELEGPDYFESIVLENFLFKEREIVKEVKKGLRLKQQQFFEINKLISPKAKILHLADDYGEGDLLLVLQEPGRKVYSYIKDKEKREVAEHNYVVKNRDLIYVQELPENIMFDVLLISSGQSIDDEFCSRFSQVINVNDYGAV